MHELLEPSESIAGVIRRFSRLLCGLAVAAVIVSGCYPLATVGVALASSTSEEELAHEPIVRMLAVERRHREDSSRPHHSLSPFRRDVRRRSSSAVAHADFVFAGHTLSNGLRAPLRC